MLLFRFTSPSPQACINSEYPQHKTHVEILVLVAQSSELYKCLCFIWYENHEIFKNINVIFAFD